MHAAGKHGGSSNNDEKGKCVNVQVVVRSRPLNTREIETKESTVINCSPFGKEITFNNPKANSGSKTFTFDAVYGPNSTQTELFEQTVRPIVDEVLNGFNCTLFAYGQTGTGKTYTMEGRPDSEIHSGVIPRSIHYIFDSLEKSASDVKVSHLELYNEELRDLLSSDNKQLRIYDGLMDVTGKRGCTVSNLEEIIVSNAQTIFQIVEHSRKRQTAETLLNANSSRSHCIFTITIHTKEATPEGEDLLKVGKLNLVDLAGSENVLRSGAAGERKREAGMINTSLLTLGRVITALTEHSNHVPYRESKLTRLLQDSLGGKTKTCIIATVSPSSGCMEETLSTLDYAHRARNIRNRPEVNQKMTKKALIKEYIAEIDKLKLLLKSTRDKTGVYVPTETYESMESELQLRRNQVGDVEQILEKREAELEVLKNSFSEKEKQLLLSKEELEKTTQKLEHTSTQYTITKGHLEQTQTQLKSHKEYEYALRSHADATLSDREQLFNKIDRKKRIEIDNKQRIDLTRQLLMDKVQSLERVISRSASAQSNFYGDFDECISEFLSQKEKQIQALNAQVQSLASLVTAGTQNLSKLASGIQAQSNDLLSSVGTAAHQYSNNWLQDAARFYKESAKAAAAINQSVAEQTEEMRLWSTNQKTTLENFNQATNSFLSQQVSVLTQLSNQVSETSANQQARVKEHQTSLVSYAGSQLSNLQEWQQALMSQIGDVVKNAVESRGLQVKHEVESLASQLDEEINDIEKQKKNVVGYVDGAMESISQYGGVFTNFVATSNIESKTFAEKNTLHAEKTTQDVQQLSSRGDEFIQQCTEAQSEFVGSVNGTIQQASESLDTMYASHSETASNSITETDAFITDYNNQMASFDQSIDQSSATWKQQINFAATETHGIHKELHSNLNFIRKDVVSVFSIKEDLPTGATPIKKPMPVPLLDHFLNPSVYSRPEPSTPTPSTPLSPTRPVSPISTPTIAPTPVADNAPIPTLSYPTESDDVLKVKKLANIKTSKIPKLSDKKSAKIANKENVINVK